MKSSHDIDALREMIPFYVNGTLADDDKAAFEAGLAQHPDLQAEVNAEKAMQSRFNTAMEEEIASVDNTGADTAPVPVQTLTSRSPEGLARALSFLNPVNWKPAVTLGVVAVAVAQTAVIGGQATMIASLEDQNYALASGLEDCEQPADLILTPSGEAAWNDVMRLLNDEKLEIVGGTAQGMLEIEIPEDSDVGEIQKRLEANEAVGSVYLGG